MIFSWPQTIAGNVPLVQAEQLSLHHFDESLPIRGNDPLLRKAVDIVDRLRLAQSLANHRRNRAGDVLSMLNAEGVGVA